MKTMHEMQTSELIDIFSSLSCSMADEESKYMDPELRKINMQYLSDLKAEIKKRKEEQ